MNSSLMVLNPAADLTEAEAMILAEMQDDVNAYDLQPTRIKVPPGGTGQFIIGEEMAKSFTGIVAISQKKRGFWPEQGTGQAPLCQSPDGAHGFFDFDAESERYVAAAQARVPHPALPLMDGGQELPQSFACATCSMNQWGSEFQKRSGEGRAKGCKETRRLLVIIDGWALPALMSLPPTSIRTWDAFCSGLAARRSAYFAVRTKFELETAKATGGETYNVVAVSLAGRIEDPAQLAAVGEIRRQYRDLVSEMPVIPDEYEVVDPAGTADDAIPF